ncbi:MAG: hypothetical protein PHT69_13725 [Bacteroidales bacterium]|nr:hypothetical protein [Bacteroidales bacterium]
MALSKSKIKLFIFIIIASGLTCLLLIIGINYYRQIKSPRRPVIDAIPQTAGLIFEINDVFSIKNKLYNECIFWKELSKINKLNDVKEGVFHIDSLLSKNEDAKSLIEGTTFYISIHPSGNNKAQFLFLCENLKNRKISYIENILEEIYPSESNFSKSTFKGIEILLLQSQNGSEKLHFATLEGIFMCSYSQQLIEDAIIRLQENIPFNNQESFDVVSATLGKKVDAVVYINYRNFYRIIHPYIAEAHLTKTAFLMDFADWSAFDINIKNEALVLNGFSETSNNEKSFMLRFAGQEPQEIELINILPYNTESFIFLGFSDFSIYYNKYCEQLNLKGNLAEHESEMTSFETQYEIDLQDFISNISNEIAYATLSSNPGENEHTNFFIIRFKNRMRMLEILAQLSLKSSNMTAERTDLSSHREYEFGFFDFPDFFNYLLGTDFELSSMNIFTTVDEYMVLGSSRDDLIKIINTAIFKRSLSNSTQFNDISTLFTSTANIQLYYNLHYSLNSFNKLFSTDISEYISSNTGLFENFDALSFQISNNNNRFYNNISFHYKTQDYEDISASLWETELENSASKTICKTINHNDNSEEVVISDINNNLYLIDKNGIIVWKHEVGENILSDIIQIDFLNNGKLQYLFNTPNFIYLIDRNGDNVGNFPIRLRSKATNGVAVFDYDNNKNYRLFLATEQKEIINLDKNGEIISGWQAFRTANPVEVPVQFIRLLGKDFLFVTENTGKFHILDRRGSIRISPNNNFLKSVHTLFYPLITSDRKGIFVTTEKSGKVATIDFNGATEFIEFPDISEEHYFIFEDVNNNSLKDYIFINKDKLFVYDYSKNLIKSIQFSSDISGAPMFFNDNSKYRIGVFTSDDSKIHLINSSFEMAEGFPLDGTCPFVVFNPKDEDKHYIIGANNKVVFKFLLN